MDFNLTKTQEISITCKSKLNVGTEFLITFPFDSEDNELAATIENHMLYEKNSAEKVNIEFSDIYI